MKVVLMTLAILLPLAASMNLMGGKQVIEVGTDDSRVQFAANTINDYLHNKNHEDNELHEAMEVISATSQVVQGMMYNFKIKMSGKPNNQICTIKIWERTWMTPTMKKSGDVECNDEILGGDDHDNKPHGENILGGDDHDYKPHGQNLLGGQEPADLNDRLVQEALKSVTHRANLASNSMYRLIPNGKGTVTKQVVNGIIFRFTDIEMEVSNCKKGKQNYSIEECQSSPNQDAKMEKVNAEVFWDRNNFEVKNFEWSV